MYYNASPPDLGESKQNTGLNDLLNYIQEIRAETEVALCDLNKQILRIKNNREEQLN